MGRPKSKIRREIINTTIDKKLLELVRDMSVDTGIPPLIDLLKTHLSPCKIELSSDVLTRLTILPNQV